MVKSVSAESVQPRRVLGFRDLFFFYAVTGISLRWIADEQREMIFSSQGARYEALLMEFRKRVFGG